MGNEGDFLIHDGLVGGGVGVFVFVIFLFWPEFSGRSFSGFGFDFGVGEFLSEGGEGGVADDGV